MKASSVQQVPRYSFGGKRVLNALWILRGFVCLRMCVHMMYVALFLSRQNERMKLS